MQGAVQLVGSSFLSVKISGCAPDMGLVSFVRQKNNKEKSSGLCLVLGIIPVQG